MRDVRERTQCHEYAQRKGQLPPFPATLDRYVRSAILRVNERLLLSLQPEEYRDDLTAACTLPTSLAMRASPRQPGKKLPRYNIRFPRAPVSNWL